VCRSIFFFFQSYWIGRSPLCFSLKIHICMHGWFFPAILARSFKGVCVSCWCMIILPISLFWLLLHACKYMLCIPAVSG
jgi:hypothetical protein